MAAQYAYNYALIDENGWCYEVRSSTISYDDWEDCIPIPSYDDRYMEKYYNRANGKWYHDAEFTNEWIPE